MAASRVAHVPWPVWDGHRQNAKRRSVVLTPVPSVRYLLKTALGAFTESEDGVAGEIYPVFYF